MRFTALALLAVTSATPLAAQETRFSKVMNAGDRLEIENINGSVEVSQGTGRTAEIVVTKTVKQGDGNLVKAIMEETSGVVRVCTIYLTRDPNRSTCRGENSFNNRGNRDRLEVDMQYTVRAPAGVHVNVETVNGNVVIRVVDTPVTVETVNGNIEVEAAGAHSLETVNGSIRGRFTRADWTGEFKASTVNGGIDLSFPATLSATVDGSTVNGGIESDFPVTIEGKWGPKSMRGTIGSGGRTLSLETVNGGIRLRRN